MISSLPLSMQCTSFNIPLLIKKNMVIAQNSNDFEMLNTILHALVHVLHIAGNVSTEILNSLCV